MTVKNKDYFLGEIKQFDQKMSQLNDIQLSLVKFYFTTAFSLSTVIIALVRYKIYENSDKVIAWFLLFPLTCFSFVTWFSLKKIIIQYNEYQNTRNSIGNLFLQEAVPNAELPAYASPFRYYYALISWLFLITLFAFIYKAIPYLHGFKSSLYIIIVVSLLVAFILFFISITALSSARKKARDSKRTSDIKQMQTAIELYYTDNGTYPIGDLDGLKKAISLIKDPYMGKIPQDPVNNEEYDYQYECLDGKEYKFYFKLEEGGNKIMTLDGVIDP